MSSPWRFAIVLGIGALGFDAWGVAPAEAAQLVVVEAHGVALRPGQAVDSTKPLQLKVGERLTLVSPAGTTLKLAGPYTGTPDADQGRAVPVANTLALLVTQRQARIGEVGTTRGRAPNTLPDPWVLDASRTGTVCLRDGNRAVLWRPDPANVADLVVAPTDRSWRTETRWPAGSASITIEPPAQIEAGATYLVTLNGSQSAMRVEAVPASLTTDPMRAAWLAEKGCEAQAEALLRNGQ
jgi:hypothetical protein